ncbi:cryptochrome/photolyase family protein [Pedobacter fastidiosus]|uniref:Cryptochrome/photolyase family protein n=1 Tax=Pedobacter fastidiosus TaxID=2765361 RepID=A0ABR7KXT5_9SPHI|nr:cryptochrome/photolyase family protein [Pedobacter fastidiosus]MBC6112934.1 cryptochrome/photolyase family protein [Pedobacter fastidiosus]
MKKKYKVLRLILGDQLNLQHSWFLEDSPSTLHVIMEVKSETDYVWHHIQKACAFFAAMENFAETLNSKGFETLYLHLDHENNKQNFSENIQDLIEKFDIEEFQYQLPDEYRLDQEMNALCTKLKISWRCFDSEHFYTSRNELTDFFSGKKEFVMESFYRAMRLKHRILIQNDDKPDGEKWNFDVENRKKLPKNHKPNFPLLFNNDVRKQHGRLLAGKIQTIGNIHPENLQWPINRSQSLELLSYFCKNCLPLFGTFQDAMHTDEWSLYHSRLSFSMNTKLISPKEVVDTALAYWKKDKSIGLNQVEGFIRQILGWREYMRGIYWMKMPEFEKLNYFNHQTKLPEWYWTGNTKMNCLKHSISQSLNFAYAHHIQRLMITGNFALLAGINPDDVDFWYLGIYIDAIQWVEITNTRGMSQYADGGIIGTKPYAATANYIHKMSNYCDDCGYNRQDKTGENSCPFNSLYWDFHDRHRAKLQHNPRLSMVYRIWDKMDAELKASVLQRANYYLENLDTL